MKKVISFFIIMLLFVTLSFANTSPPLLDLNMENSFLNQELIDFQDSNQMTKEAENFTQLLLDLRGRIDVSKYLNLNSFSLFLEIDKNFQKEGRIDVSKYLSADNTITIKNTKNILLLFENEMKEIEYSKNIYEIKSALNTEKNEGKQQKEVLIKCPTLICVCNSLVRNEKAKNYIYKSTFKKSGEFIKN